MSMIFSDRELSKRLERAEASVNAALVESHARLSPDSCATWLEVAGCYALFDGIQSPCTQTFGLGMFEEITAENLDELETFFKKRKAPVLHEISPFAEGSLLPLLCERGYRPLEYTNVMFLPIAQPFQNTFSVNPDIKIRIIKTGEVNLWAETSAKGWIHEMPNASDFMYEFGQIIAGSKNCYPFLAEINNIPIATGTLFIFDGVAIIVGTSTILEKRNQGAQMALLNAHIQFAIEKGCNLVMMAASPGSQSQKNGEKSGFRIAYTRTKWLLS